MRYRTNSRPVSFIYILLQMAVFTALGLYLVLNYHTGAPHLLGKMFLIFGNGATIVVYLCTKYLFPKIRREE